MSEVPEYDERARLAILAELGRVLEGGTLGDGSRLRALLRFVVSEELEGRGDRLKAYTIATMVLGRGEDFDPSTDSIVRVEMNRLRKALELFYSAGSDEDGCRINLPKGTYQPNFVFSEVQADASLKTRRPIVIAVSALAVLALLLAAGGLAYFDAWQDEPVAMPDASGPRVGVEPFAELTESPAHPYLAYGLTVDLVAELSRFEWMSVFLHRQQTDAEGLPALGQSTPFEGIDYRLSGSVRQGKFDLIVNIMLSDARTGEVLLTKSYRESPTAKGLIQMQQDAAAQIAVEVGRPGGLIARLEERRAVRDTTLSISAYGCVLQTYDYWRSFSPETHAKVRACLEGAITDDSNYAEAYAALAFMYLDEHRYGYNPRGQGDALARSGRMARKAYELNASSTLAAQALFTYYSNVGDLDAFREIGGRAVVSSPNNPELLADFGNKLALDAGEWSRGVALIQSALERNGDPPGWYFIGLAYDAYWRGAYGEALEWSNRMGGSPRLLYRIIRLASLVHLEDKVAMNDEIDALIDAGYGDLAAMGSALEGMSIDDQLAARLLADMRVAYTLGQGTPG